MVSIFQPYSISRIVFFTVLPFTVAALVDSGSLCAQSQTSETVEQPSHPNELLFRRQAVSRLIFDKEQSIPLAVLEPSKTVSFDLMHPELDSSTDVATCTVDGDTLTVVSTTKQATSFRWFSGFNPFATHDISFKSFTGTGDCGLSFRDSEQQDSLHAEVNFADGKPIALTWRVIQDSKEVDLQRWDWPTHLDSTTEPLILRVQMSAVGVNVLLESKGQSHLVGYADFSQHFDLREKSRSFRYRTGLSSRLEPQSRVEILSASASLSPGSGQADLRAITDETGAPLFEDGRLWLTVTLRGRALPHPTQGVFSMNPSVFDLRFEGMIVFDMGDGLLRNELASHLFRDSRSGEWRGWTTGFSAFGTKAEKESKTILAVWSSSDPRRGFSIMRAKPVGIDGAHEDPHCVFDSDAKKWRLLLCEHGEKYQAAMWQSDDWDHGFERIAGPVDVDSTGTLIQKIGDTRYVLFGSADRTIYIRSYPDLKPAGELNIELPPWNDQHGTRVWPNVIPMPEGYPAPFIALMMDRANFPGMPKPNWTYGALYLYHGNWIEHAK